MIEDVDVAVIEVSICEEDLDTVGVVRDEVDLDDLAGTFEAILQEDYYFSILRQALDAMGIDWRR